MVIERHSFGSSLIEIVLVLCAMSFFLMVVAVLFIVRTFVKYHKHKALWIALAICAACIIVGLLLYKLLGFNGYLALSDLGIAELLITCYVVDLKHRDTLQPEKTSIVDQVLHSSWWSSEDTPREEVEQRAA